MPLLALSAALLVSTHWQLYGLLLELMHKDLDGDASVLGLMLSISRYCLGGRCFLMLLAGISKCHQILGCILPLRIRSAEKSSSRGGIIIMSLDVILIKSIIV